MVTRVHTLLLTLLFCGLVTFAALAQDTPLPSAAPPPAHLAFVDGEVDLVHEGVTDRVAGPSMLVDGDRVHTLNGRAEIVFADGTLLHLDHDAELELLSPSRLRLLGGRLLLRVSAAATAPYVIDTPAASVRMEPRGEYGLTADGRLERLEVTVARGIAAIDESGVRTIVRGGEMASVLGPGGRVLLDAFNTARWDAFARWSYDRTQGFSTTLSARQLPQELRPYGPALDRYGRWDDLAPYGSVWYPAVTSAWRPYYTGSWALTRYGWTWYGADPWSWPTHHFGRWGYSGSAWYWIPTSTWGPAWVSWSVIPGYVGWSPLGWNGRPVLGFPGRAVDNPAYWPTYDPWCAWTIVPRDAFLAKKLVRTHAVDPRTLPEPTRRVLADIAVPRGAISVPGGAAARIDTAVPRSAIVHARRPGAVRSPNAAPRAVPPPSAASRADLAVPADTVKAGKAPIYSPGAYSSPVYVPPVYAPPSSKAPKYTPPSYRPPTSVAPSYTLPPAAPMYMPPAYGAPKSPPYADRTRPAMPSYAVPRGEAHAAGAAAAPAAKASSSGERAQGGAKRKP